MFLFLFLFSVASSAKTQRAKQSGNFNLPKKI